MQTLLWMESILKLAGGLVLITLPLTAAQALGLPKPTNGLWQRLLGAVLIGLAIGTYTEAATSGARGLDVFTNLVINLMSAGLLAGLLILGQGAPTRRGRVALWTLVIILIGLSLAEIYYI